MVYNFWNNDFDIVRTGKFSNIFQQQLLDENITLNNGDKIIFDCCNEGIGPKDISLAVDSLLNSSIHYDIRVLFNVPVFAVLPYKYRCFPEHFVAHCGFVAHIQTLEIDWKNLMITKKFIALMRRASVERVTLAKRILSKFKHNNFLLSCGTQPSKWKYIPTALAEAIYPYKLPILLDGVTDNYQDQHHHKNTDFFACCVHLAIETSSQTDVNSWREIFISEKSLKPFAYRQLPIWFAVPGTVNEIRKLGFDVYDDIIDHSYDLEQNTYLRMSKVLDALNTVTAVSTENMNNRRANLWTRINKNVQLLYALYNTHHATKHNHLLELLK